MSIRKYLDEAGLRVLAENIGGGGGGIDITSITTEEIDAIIGESSGGSNSSTGMTPFRIKITRSPKQATSSINKDATLGPWANLGPWQIATCYGSTDLQVAGIYNNDIIQIFGFHSTGTGSPSEYLNTPSIVINRSDEHGLDNFIPDYGVCNGFITFRSGEYKRNLGVMTMSCWQDKIEGVDRFYLNARMFCGVSIGGSSADGSVVYADEGSSSIPNDDKKYDIAQLACNFSWCRADLLKTEPDTVL